jgi:hypothetical protein
MAGLASYDRTETKDRYVLAALRQLLGGYGNFTGTRHPYYGHLLVGSTVPLETIYRAGKKLGGYELVEPADDDGIFAFARCYLAFYLFNHNCTSPNKVISRELVLRSKLPAFVAISYYGGVGTSQSSIGSRFVLTHYQGLSIAAHYKTLDDCFPQKQ